MRKHVIAIAISAVALAIASFSVAYASWQIGELSIQENGEVSSLLYKVEFYKKTADASPYRTILDLEIDSSFDLEYGFEDGYSYFSGWKVGSYVYKSNEAAYASVASLLTNGATATVDGNYKKIQVRGDWVSKDSTRVLFHFTYNGLHSFQYSDPVESYRALNLNPIFSGQSGRPKYYTYTDAAITAILKKDPFKNPTYGQDDKKIYPNDDLNLKNKANSTYVLTPVYA